MLFREHLGELSAALSAPAPSGAERAAEPGHLLVATSDREVVGFAHVLVLEDGHDRIAHLEQVSVLPEHGRRGLGARLVRAAAEEARWDGFDRLTLCTYRDVPWNAPFYARIGFEVVEPRGVLGELRDRERSRGLDEAGERVVMALPLGHR
ncbi:acetyltransferase [Nocardioides dokdonensis FR1436]|uniref:Acetyltransferase n=1 Tax=Nocardioides dokdonensis FR1436 TaxID=1300347 RepID=A0A1A9GRQ1_9ACTN|nr:acetyltransferase [Nocardioides dokdonensis FR1436]